MNTLRKYAPKLKEIEITDIKKGLGGFVPKADKLISFAALKETLKKAGYALDSADITIAGKLIREGDKWLILNESSGQKFYLESKTLDKLTANIESNSVLLPIDYQKPGKELFLILETTLLTRSKGRLGGIKVSGSSSTEFYLSPGLQYAADPRFVIEGSIQIPIFRNSGALALRTDYNLLLGVKYLF